MLGSVGSRLPLALTDLLGSEPLRSWLSSELSDLVADDRARDGNKSLFFDLCDADLETRWLGVSSFCFFFC